MSEFNDIWQDGKGKLPEEKLIAYLEGKLSAEEQHEVEAWLGEEGMEADALEGLQELPAAESKKMIGRLNHNLQQQLTHKSRRRRKQIKDNPWAWVAVVILLLLAILGYVVVKMIAKP